MQCIVATGRGAVAARFKNGREKKHMEAKLAYDRDGTQPDFADQPLRRSKYDDVGC